MEINDGVGVGDDFYEKIEAPKFVDLTAPDHFRPSNDDRYWFCLRVGCDQKHEEEMDSEEIYKNFVLRVMAARSPNVRFRKALCRKDPSTNLKCPLTVPAKSSKSRISRLALVSSISQKMVDGKVKAGPLPKHSVTPNVKSKQSSVVAKSMTTPQNKQHLSNPGTFRSVRNPKPTSIAVPKNRVVAKALVFHSPKKTVKIKNSAELSSRMQAICAGMKKLEITGGEKQESGNNKTLPLDAPRKQFRGREVKSRVYDSLQRSKNCQSKVVKSSKCSKKKIKEKDAQQVGGEGNDNDSSDMEIEEKSRNGSLEVCSTLDCSKSNERNEQDEECLVSIKKSEIPLSENKGEVMSNTSRNNMSSLSNREENNPREDDDLSGENNKTNEGTAGQEKDKSNSEKRKVINGDDKENATSSNDKETESTAAMSNDDNENSSSADDNRILNLDSSLMEKKKILGKHETCKSFQTVSKGMCKTSKGNSAPGVTCAEGINYRKPKLTNPKPFRLRTDERQILKEANLEKKLHPHEPLKEVTTIARVPGGSSQRKVKKAVHRNERYLEHIEYASDAHDGSETNSDKTKQKDEPLRMKTSCSQTLKGALGRKQSTTQKRGAIPVHQKTKQQELGQDRTAKKSQKIFRRTKSLCKKQSTVTQGTESKKTVSHMTPGRLGVIKELSPTNLTTKVVPVVSLENGASPLPEIPASGVAPRSTSSAGRRRLTVPKEPHFHDVHRPKSCTRRVT